MTDLPNPLTYMTANERNHVDAFHDALADALSDRPDLREAMSLAFGDPAREYEIFNLVLRLMPRHVRRLAKLADRAEHSAERRQKRRLLNAAIEVVGDARKERF